jgi:RNA polymerase-binding transcription factor DksA
MPIRPLLLGPNGPALKPLIPSGKDNKVENSVLDNVTSRRTKTPLTKTQLEKYRMILLQKRMELLGDIEHLEEEALRSDSGRTSHTSQHHDDAGSESYEQSLNLNLAASDRERLNEIDAALQRIKDRTYGLCEMTFEPISRERLDEIPWTRYTIAAARELDRRGGKR